MTSSSIQAKKRKVIEVNRMFNASWELDFLFTLSNDKPVCLICQNSIAVLKKSNLQRHYTSLHNNFDKLYPLGTKVREDKVASLKKNLNNQQSVFRRMLSSSDCATEASLKISWVLAKKQKSYSDGETVKLCFQECADSLFAEYKNKDEIKKRIANLQLSHQTVTRRVDIISRNIFEQMLFDLRKASGFSLALDESCDVTDTEQLIVWVRFDMEQKFKEELLALIPLQNTRTGEDIYKALKDCLLRNDINMRKLISVTTDGAPAMVGRRVGLIGLLMADNDFPAFQAYHCIIHQQALCSKLKHDELQNVMGIVVKIVNFIRANPLNHRQFKALLKEYDSNYSDFVLHTDVRWLSKGKVLTRLWDLIEEVKIFLTVKSKKELLKYLETPKFIVLLAFLTDITDHLNKLNLKLQGQHHILPTLMKEISVFETKLDLFIRQLNQSNFMHFPALSKAAYEFPDLVRSEQFSISLEQLKLDFSARFKDIRSLNPLLRFVENPFTCDISIVATNMQLLGGDEGAIQLEIIEIQHNMALREKHKDTLSTEFWMTYVSSDEFPQISKCCKKILTMFGSTYVCETGFSAMTNIKSKKRNSLTEEHLENLMRASVTEYQPQFKKIADTIQSQVSH